MKVLILHRQQSFLQMIREKFLSGGWQVQTANSGLDGLLTARHHPFDLMLCGFDLPVISGTEVVRTTRMLSQNTHTPVFFISTGEETESQIYLAEQLQARLLSAKEIEESMQVAWFTN